VESLVLCKKLIWDRPAVVPFFIHLTELPLAY
jgi:hypothetical protein